MFCLYQLSIRTAFLCFAECYVVGFVIELDELAPQCLFRQFVSSLATLIHLLLAHRRELGYGILDGISHLRVVVVRTVNHLHAVFYLTIASAKLAVSPKTESSQA